MFGGRNIEEEITKKEVEKQKQLRVDAQAKGIALSSNSMDSFIYGGQDKPSSSATTSSKSKKSQNIEFGGFQAFNSTTKKKLNSKIDEDLFTDKSIAEDNTSNWRKAVQSKWAAPQQFLEESAEIMGKIAEDPLLAAKKKKTIADREDEYRSRWRKRALDVEIVDPYAKNTSEEDKKKKRTYAELVLESQIEREKRDAIFDIKKKQAEIERIQKLKETAPTASSQASSSSAAGTAEEQKESVDRSDKRRRIQSDAKEGKVQRWGKPEEEEEPQATNIVKEQPNFGQSGKLASQSKTVSGIEMKWHDPPEARLPTEPWRVYCFKEDKVQGNPIKLDKQPSYIFGREETAVDVPCLHQSISKQHAVIVFRNVPRKNAKIRIRPYIIDLSSRNGTFLNGNQITDSVFIELKHKDVLKFGTSTREYVVLREEEE